MSKCIKCSKSGFFLKINTNGFCKECERLEFLEAEEKDLRDCISTIQDKIEDEEDALAELVSKKNNLFRQIKSDAERAALKDVADELDKKKTRLGEIDKMIFDSEIKLRNAQEAQNKSEKSAILAANKLKKIQDLFKSLQYSVEFLNKQELNAISSRDRSLSAEVDEVISTTIKLNLQSMSVRELKKNYQANEKLIFDLLEKYKARYTTKTNAAIYKLMVIALEAELQNTLFNLRFAKLDESLDAIKKITKKYLDISIEGNQSIAPTITRFIGEIEYLFINAINIEYEYYVKKEQIKDEQRIIREQMRQESAERKILEEQRKKVEQEESKYKTELSSIHQLISETTDIERTQQLQERLSKIQSQLEEVEHKKDSIISLQNGKAGYIYVISNLGSFGDNVFKVGMTRRLDPQDRVDELGDASVPFRFDVHSFIFSNNAPYLENELHKQLNDRRVNKINLRKEFFNCTIDELEELVFKLEPTAAFNKTMFAEQYYQSMQVKEVPLPTELPEFEEEATVGEDE